MNKKKIPLILECANAHGGDFDLLKSTVESFKIIEYSNKHIKFQPFHPDTISLPDFAWHSTYEELLLNQNQWTELINIANKHYDGVWLDLFDCYGVEILKDNINNISGIKIQASVLENQEIISALKQLNLANTHLMLNISGFDISDIEQFVAQFSELKAMQTILQIGHQSYPTKIKDSGLQKIHILKVVFPKLNICIADHSSAEDDLTGIIPLLGVAAGCRLVEKHICLNRSSAKYDSYSALEPNQIQLLATRLNASQKAIEGYFIPKSEEDYLEKSIQVPVTKENLPGGSLISKQDVLYRRTDQTGLSFNDLSRIQKQHQILSKEIDKKTTITKDHFRPARIGAIVACRMKSSRLKTKATLPILGQSSVERCLESCLRIPSSGIVVLATSTVEDDAILKNYTLAGKAKFWRGSPDDVIQRYLGACDAYNIDVIIRVTADCPVVSAEIAETLLKHHFATGADYTAAKSFAVGTACEIYNTEVLRRVIKYLGVAEYSEYMTWYLQNNSDIFKVEMVDLPAELIRNYRLTLDHQEDLDLFEKLYQELAKENKEPSLQNIFAI